MNKDPKGKKLHSPAPVSLPFYLLVQLLRQMFVWQQQPVSQGVLCTEGRPARETPWSLAQDLYLSLQIREVGLGRGEKPTVKLDQIGKTVMHEILS